ncbi:MAG TPA: aminotransferase class IV, partial [Steroidobacteraceae bacterium]|nr:aminotransferase class IV [Steroidobacteraceae bacterium]
MADPLPLCYLNGAYLPLTEARISPLDRGFLYADAVYELMPVYGGRPFRFTAHAERLTSSLAGVSMADPHSRAEWRAILGTLIERNGGGDMYVYWQVTRGAQHGRTHAPLPEIPRTVFAFCAPLPVTGAEVLERGVACVTASDSRWARCDIKSTALLANVLLRQLSAGTGAAETILLRGGELTEASASAVHVVIGGELRMPPHSQRILPGTTRGVVEELAERIAMPCRWHAVS